MLVWVVVVNDVAGLIENGPSGKENHGSTEPSAEIESSKNGYDDQSDSDESGDF